MSTMLFLLAMQKNPTSKKSPFRLVDEMNQVRAGVGGWASGRVSE